MIKYDQITTFLNEKNIAIVGVSRNSKDFSRTLYKEFKTRGYTVYPVNPNTDEIENEKCYAQIEDISSKIDALLVLTPTLAVVNSIRTSLSKGIKHIWFYNGNEKDEAFQELIKTCIENGINTISGYCPFMFFPGTAFPHWMHGFITKLFGKYPQ